MHADRWSATAWIVALLVDVALCVYFAAGVCLQPAWPQRGPRGAQLVRAGETVCDEAYFDRQRVVEPILEREVESLIEERKRTRSSKRGPGLAAHIEDAERRLASVRWARAQCDELQVAIRARVEAEESWTRTFDARARAAELRAIAARTLEVRAAELRAAIEEAAESPQRLRSIPVSEWCIENWLVEGCW